MKKKHEKFIILIDGTCTFCSRSAMFIRKHCEPGTFLIFSLSSDEGKYYLNKYNFPIDYSDSIVMIEKNKVYLKSTAVLKICKKMNSVFSFLYIFIIIPPPVRNFVYNSITYFRH